MHHPRIKTALYRVAFALYSEGFTSTLKTVFYSSFEIGQNEAKSPSVFHEGVARLLDELKKSSIVARAADRISRPHSRPGLRSKRLGGSGHGQHSPNCAHGLLFSDALQQIPERADGPDKEAIELQPSKFGPASLALRRCSCMTAAALSCSPASRRSKISICSIQDSVRRPASIRD